MQKTKYPTCFDETTFEHFYKRWGKKWLNLKHLFKWACHELNFYPFTKSKFLGKIKTIELIYKSNQKENEDTIKKLIKKYFDEQTPLLERIVIKYGPGGDIDYINKLKAKSVGKIGIGSIEYWMNKGFSKEQAEKEKSEYYKNLSKKATKKFLELMTTDLQWKKDIYKKISKTKKERKNKQYWIDLGYSEKEADAKVKSYLPPVHSLENYITKYGPKEGPKKHKQFYETTKQSRIRRFGTAVQSGYVSKSSIRFFIPLYKKLRKNGFQKNDIIWGIGKNREFTTFDKDTNKNYAFDFVIKSKKIIIEYNDPFWHARDKEEWKNPMIDYEFSIKRDELKKTIAKKLGFDILYIWSDKLPTIEDLKNIIISK